MVLDVTRREFLLVNVTTSVAILLHPRLEQELTPVERRTLLAVSRTIFRHDHLSDALYLRAVSAVEARCREDVATFHELLAALKVLELRCRGSFSTATFNSRSEAIKDLEESQFFAIVYKETLDSLYGLRGSWAVFRRQERGCELLR